MKGFVKIPHAVCGRAGFYHHMHFDIDMSHILHTQFAGRKGCFISFEEQYKLYRKPWEVWVLPTMPIIKKKKRLWKFPSSKTY